MRNEVVTFVSTERESIAAIRSFLYTVYANNGNTCFLDFDVLNLGGYHASTFVFDVDFYGANGIINMFKVNGGLQLLDNVVTVYYIEETYKVAIIDRFDNKPSLHWVASVNDGVNLVNGADLSPVPFLAIVRHMLNCLSAVFYKYMPLPKDNYDDKLIVVIEMADKRAYLGKNQKPIRDISEAALFELNNIGQAVKCAKELSKSTPKGVRIGVCSYSGACKDASVGSGIQICTPLPSMTYWVSGKDFVEAESRLIAPSGSDVRADQVAALNKYAKTICNN